MKYYFNPISKLCPKVKAFILSEKVYVKKKKDRMIILLNNVHRDTHYH